MTHTTESIDPLEAKSVLSTAAAQAAIKREIENILSSYVGWFDPFSELIQNALDSTEERQSKSKTYKPAIRIIINIQSNTLTVTDNGTGLSKEKFRQFLAPSFSFKSGKTRGHKGVGATYLAYGFNYLQVATRTSDYEHIAKMENARQWLSDTTPPSNPLLVRDRDGCHDSEFDNYDKGVSITIKFDKTTVPGDLKWIKADTAVVWRDILLTKTGLGAVNCVSKTQVYLEVIDKNGKSTHSILKTTEYNWPHLIVSKSQKLRDVQSKSDKLFEKHGKDYRMPAAFRNLDCIYDTFNSEELKDLITLSSEDQDVISKYDPLIYLCYVHSARLWSDYNEKLKLRSNIDILKPGIQIAANSMPQGEIIQIPLTRNIGRQNQVHFVAHFDNCKPDLGRKGFQKEVVSFCEEIARKLIEGPFLKVRSSLRAATGAKTDLKRESAIDDWKVEMALHEKEAPLLISNPHFFLPVKQVAITSAPTREQDVIALFNQLIAGGVIRGIKIMSTNERFTYDGMYRINFTPPEDNHIYHQTKNPLGITAENCNTGFSSNPKILEYKYSLDGLIEDIDSGDKNSKDIGLVVVWETGSTYQLGFHILSLLDTDNLSERQYHGVTHVIQNYQSSAREMDLIVLSELIDYLNDPKKTIKAQKAKYDV